MRNGNGYICDYGHVLHLPNVGLIILKRIAEVLRTSQRLARVGRTNKKAISALKWKLAGYVSFLALLISGILIDLPRGGYFINQLRSVYGIVSLYLLEFLRDSINNVTETEEENSFSSKPSTVPISGVSQQMIEPLQTSKLDSRNI